MAYYSAPTGSMPPTAWQGRATDYPREAAVHTLFEEQAGRHPEAVALVDAAGTLSYGELNALANRLAEALIAAPLPPGAPVAVCLDRSRDFIASILGILKAGGCYVPLDPAYPAARLQTMAEETGAELLLSSRELAANLPSLPGKMLFAEEIGSSANDAANPGLKVPATRPAYIMFTSGSTGRPKGVVVPHRAIVRLVRGQDYLHLGPEETFLQFAPVSFDASTLEIWAPLLNGGRVALAPGGALSLAQIAETIRALGVTSMWLTSGLFNLMTDEQPDAFGTLRQLLAGGDVLSKPHVRKVLDACPSLRLINGYGPTESTTFACCHTITRGDLELPSIPIGAPICNTTVRILDEHGAQVPIGEPGELFIGGDGLALGYWNRPDLTAEKFVDLEGERFYRTGDRVQWIESGAIQFLGRQDHQVKVRGYRIELGEIEAALSHQPGVLRSTVIALGDGADKQLAAYYAGSAEPDQLRAALREALPDYMAPAFFTRLESLPLTENGKVDRARLPSPIAAVQACQPPEAPRTEMEGLLARLWAEVLGLPSPGLNANFFDLGGTSLKLVEAHSRLVRSLRRQIPVTALFQYPTIASLAAWLGAENATSTTRLTAAAERARMQREALARKQLSRKVP